MKKFSLHFSLMLIVLFSCHALAETINSNYVEGEVLVVINAPSETDYLIMGAFNADAYSSAIINQANGFTRTLGLMAINTFPEIARDSGKSIIHIRSENKSTSQLIRELSSIHGVISVSPNLKYELTQTPNDPYYPQLWGMVNIGMPQVWDYETGSNAVYVAVLDSGIDYYHQDLAANITKDTYNNYGRRFENGTWSYDPMDVNSHGTHVAGTIGAVGNNNIGVTGVNWNVKMLAV